MDKEPELNNKDIAKFSRQIILPEFRVKSQRKLKVRKKDIIKDTVECRVVCSIHNGTYKSFV